MMIIIESHQGDYLLTGASCRERTLRHRMRKTLAMSHDNTAIFVRLFCYTYQFNVWPYDDEISADYIMDLDTALVYRRG